MKRNLNFVFVTEFYHNFMHSIRVVLTFNLVQQNLTYLGFEFSHVPAPALASLMCTHLVNYSSPTKCSTAFRFSKRRCKVTNYF